jgi:hypothetical protein
MLLSVILLYPNGWPNAASDPIGRVLQVKLPSVSKPAEPIGTGGTCTCGRELYLIADLARGGIFLAQVAEWGISAGCGLTVEHLVLL